MGFLMLRKIRGSNTCIKIQGDEVFFASKETFKLPLWAAEEALRESLPNTKTVITEETSRGWRWLPEALASPR